MYITVLTSKEIFNEFSVVIDFKYIRDITYILYSIRKLLTRVSTKLLRLKLSSYEYNNNNI